MSIGPVGDAAASAAGAPYAQSQSAAATGALRAAAARSHELHAAGDAETAHGIGDANADLKPHERHADGRLAWEQPQTASDESNAHENGATPSVDSTGERGGQLDLLG